MRRNSILVTVAAVALIGLLAVGDLSATLAQEDASTTDHPLVGSWLVAVTLEGQEPGAPLPTELTSLVTYFADGNVLVAKAGQLPPLPPGSGLFFTDGHGQWVTTGESTADATFVSLILDQTGGLSSTNTTRTSVEVDTTTDVYTGTFVIESESPTGNSVKAERGTFQATRIQEEPTGTPAPRSAVVAMKA